MRAGAGINRACFFAVTCVRSVQLSFIHKNETFTEFVRKK